MRGFAWPLREAGLAAGILAIVLALAFNDVIFGSRTLATSGAVPSIHPAGVREERDPAVRPTVLDPEASAWADEPYFLVTRRALAAGTPPLWNPDSGCGAPLQGNLLSAPWYPLNAILHLAPAVWRWDAFLLARLLVAGFFTFRFLRLFAVSVPASLTGAVAFMLCGHMTLCVSINHLSVDVMHPVLLCAVERLVRTGRWGGVCLATAVTILGGMPEPIVFVLLVGGCWFLFRLADPEVRARIGAGRLLVRWAGASAAGILLAAPFLLPFLEFLRHSTHRHGEDTGLLHWDPRLAVHLLNPAFFQTPGFPLASMKDWRGVPYLGFLPVFLALVGLGRREGLGPLRGFFAGLAAFALLKAFGAPLVQEVGRLPILELCIFTKYLFPALALAVACLAAQGADRLARGGAGKGTLLAAFLAPAAVLAGFALAFPAGTLFLSNPIASRERDLFPSVAAPAGALVALLGVHLARRSGARLAPALVLLAAVAAETVLLVPRGRPARSDPSKPPAFLDAVPRGDGRLLATGGCLVPNWGAALGFRDVRVLDAMMVRQYHDFVQATIEPGVWNDRWSGRERDWYDPGDRWLRFLAVRWIVSPRPAPFPPRFGREGLRYLAAGEPGSSRAGREDGPETVRLAPSEELRLTLRVPDRSPALVLEPALEGDARLEATVREPEFGTVLRTVWPRSGDAEAETVRAELGPWRGRRVLLHLAAAPVEELTRTDATLVLSGLRLGRDPLPFDGLVRHIPWEGPRPLLVRGPPGGDAMLALPAFGHAELKLQVPEEEAELELRVRAAGPAGTPRIALLIAIAGEAREHVLWSGSRTDATSRVEADLSPWAGREVELALRAAGGDGSGPALARGVEVRTDAAQTLVPVHRTGPYVYRNDAALPRAFVVHRAEVARSDAEGLERLRAPDFDPARTVLLSDPVPAERLAPAVREGSRSVARIAREAADEVEVEATLDAPGFLVLSDVHYPGWRVEVDGARAPLHRANHAFRAVWLPAGRHVARFRYVCGPWRLGLALAGATAALVALAAVRGVRSPRGT